MYDANKGKSIKRQVRVVSKKSPFGSATAAAGITKDKKGNVTSALFPETKKTAPKKKK